MSAMFLAMVWHARRRVQALETVQALAEERASLLEQQERLLQNVSHELRTPVTIARGHLELLAAQLDTDRPELTVAFDELQRIEQIVDRVLLLARVERTDWVSRSPFSSCRSSRTSSCAGRRSPRVPGTSVRSST